jgi:uncharacterized protein (DUF1330 family)
MKTQYALALAVVAGFALGAVAVQGLQAQAKPPVYLISSTDVTNVDAYMNEYLPKVRASIKAAGGRQLVASQQITLVEGNAPKARITIDAWDSVEQMQAWRNSTDYKAARQIGDKYAKFRSFLVEGVPQ